MKNREIRELLEIALNNFDKIFGSSLGLCGYFTSLHYEGIINGIECAELILFIYNNKPRTVNVKNDYRYFWPEGKRNERKAYLQRMIDKLDKKAAGITQTQRTDR
jgi:hypothetical protein